jgi:demethylmenaquinone methyltransferase/2-methoxy-6-polyprenyl-1,4-benzoquinol methylase
MTTPAPPSSSPAIWSATDLAGNPHESADKAQRVRGMFAAIAPTYDLNNRLHSFGLDQSWRRAAVRMAEPRPGDRVLDAACGTGDLAELFARSGVAEVVGVDFTEAMLAIARRRAARRFPATARRPSYRLADVLALPFADASFDIVSIAFGLRNVADPGAAVREFRRVLRPGGRLVILEFSTPANPVARRLNDLYSRRILPVTASLLAGDRSGAYRYLPRSIATFPSPEGLSRLLAESGFEEPRLRPLALGVCTVLVGRAGQPRMKSARIDAAAMPGSA